MRIGAVFPQTEIGDDPVVIRDWAQAVEELGYRHILAFDHVIGAGVDTRPGWSGYTSDDAFHEVFVLFGYLAGITSTVELAY
jgi:alkanesulfonate monooxygenase SsuD/methylene tetrahydromethanopterin reductase-like flavin-dependent oxidoreductase (luciferase family)